MRTVDHRWNAFTTTRLTAFEVSSSTGKFLKSFGRKIGLLYDFEKFPQIKDQLQAIESE